MKRLAPVMAILAMLIPAAGHALGLGNIVMHSALNQPLDAEIELLSVQSGDLDNLAVSLGSTEDFARVGADRAFFLTKIVFTVEQKANGSHVVKLSTTDRVTEPFLDFVVEARWPRGRVLREFTVLVDPPVLSDEAPAPIQQPAIQAGPAPTAVAPQPKSVAPAAPTTAVRQAPMPERAQLTPVMKRDGELSYGPVKRNDTLWEIANKMRPNESVSVNQMMIALVRDNPNAFYNGNVNQLKAGYVLRVEDPSTIGAVSMAAADAEVERQRVEWKARKSGRLVAQVAAPEGQMAGAGATSMGAAEQAARLKLVAPGKEGAGSGAGGAEATQLRQDLLIAAEALDANRQETEELKTRLTEMEEQLQAMQRLIMLKDDEMLALQKQLGATPAEPAKAPAEAVMEEEAPAAEMAPAPAAEQAPAAKPAAVPASVTEAEEPGLFDSPLLMYGGIALIAAALVGWMVVRRRKMQEGFQESILNVEGGGGAAGMATAAGGESSMVSDFAMSEMSDMEGIHADSAEVDPISEADVYLAYGRHQQAEDIIREALKKTPDRNELKLKMLEVYFAAKNRNAFEKQAEELHSALGNESDPLWARAVTMGHQLCPDNELFGGVSVDTLKQKLGGDVSAAEEDLLDFDFDLDSSELDSSAQAETSGGMDFESELATSGGDEGLDFNMDFESMDKPVATKAEGKPAAGRADNALDFDVSSLDFSLDQGEGEAKASEHGALDFDMGSLETAEEAESAAEETSFGELSLEDASVEEKAPLEMDLGDLSFDEGEAAVAEEPALAGELGEDMFGEVDEVGTKLDLAKAYVDMGDSEGARSILDEVLEEGDASQKQQAKELLAQIH